MCAWISPKPRPWATKTPAIFTQIAHTCTRLMEMVEHAADQSKVPLVLGGDHSIAIGTIAGMSSHFRKSGRKLGLIWIDAHADMNTPESSPSGNIHGMPLACSIGIGPRELTHLGRLRPENRSVERRHHRTAQRG